MNRVKLSIIILCVFIGTICFKILYKNTLTQDRINYKILVDNQASASFPSKNSGNYTVKVACQTAKAKWDYENWKLSISNSVVSDKCFIEFNTISEENKNYISEHIKNNIGTTQGKNATHGKIINENGYRYEGINPYNYVMFNNELWRIIGAFDTEVVTDNNNKENHLLTKIIRNSTIGSYTFNFNDENYWENTRGKKSNLNLILNNYYYYALDGTDAKDESDNNICAYKKGLLSNCDFRSIGINTENRNMIENVTWYLGGTDNAYSSEEMYNAERGTSIPSGGEHAVTSSGYIGLAYPSDYGYSVKSNLCNRNVLLSNYNTSNCGGESWMFSNGYEWTITPNTRDLTHVFYTNGYGNIESENTNITEGLSVRPTLYLKSNTFIVDGNGTISNPYIIAN